MTRKNAGGGSLPVVRPANQHQSRRAATVGSKQSGTKAGQQTVTGSDRRSGVGAGHTGKSCRAWPGKGSGRRQGVNAAAENSAQWGQ